MALRIKEIAKAKGITMAEIADKMGINPVNLSSSLNGNPTLNRLQEVADILGVDVSDLFSKEKQTDIYGFLEYNGKVYKIDGVDDFKAFANMIK
jgi:transcriptional regulator with XRE-family HTH domain